VLSSSSPFVLFSCQHALASVLRLSSLLFLSIFASPFIFTPITLCPFARYACFSLSLEFRRHEIVLSSTLRDCPAAVVVPLVSRLRAIASMPQQQPSRPSRHHCRLTYCLTRLASASLCNESSKRHVGSAAAEARPVRNQDRKRGRTVQPASSSPSQLPSPCSSRPLPLARHRPLQPVCQADPRASIISMHACPRAPRSRWKRWSILT
jgi:hypothetical protein